MGLIKIRTYTEMEYTSNRVYTIAKLHIEI
jgi:hypothetical protein